MNEKQFLLVILGFFLFLWPLSAGGQAGGQGKSAPSPDRLNTIGSDLNDALSTMDSALAVDEEPTLEDEYYLGRAVTANILTVYKPYTLKPELTRYLNCICQTIAINSFQPEIFNGYHVLILDSNEFNSFASPGGHILIMRGLLEVIPSEDVLAALIAHEMAHILLKHGVGIIADMRLNERLTSTADRASGIAAGESIAAARAALFRDSVTALCDTLMKNGFSRAQEFEADNAAITLLAASGYDPNGLIEMLKILQRVQTTRAGGFNSLYPSPEERITNADRMTGRYRVQDTRSYRISRFRNK
ncbi:MAG: M48 family metalloprotease [Treponema sp.]|nr:M48 family metalloprotease [Treponema sp.]